MAVINIMNIKEKTDKYNATIVVVDDTPENLFVLSEMLEQQGYQVRKALNGRVALMTCKKRLPDLILLDINMPEMDGYEVCEHLKKDEKTSKIPVIFISALDSVLDKVKAFDVGGVDYITKPFKCAEVISRIESQLKLRSLQAKLEEKNLLLEQEIINREKAQAALELSEAKNLALLNAIPDLMLLVNSDGTFLDYRTADNSHNDSPFSIEENQESDLGLSQKTNLNEDTVVEQIEDLSPNQENPLQTANFSEKESNFIGKKVSEVLSEDLAIWLMHYVEQTLLSSDIEIAEFMKRINDKWHGYETRFVKSGQDEVLAIVRDVSHSKEAEAQRLQTEALLRMQKQQLEKTLGELKQAQSQLVQNEKMVGLGQLVSGIAHEINNPISFIYGNITYLDQYIQDLLFLVDTYQEKGEISAQAKARMEEIELEFLKEDVKKLSASMRSGAERIRQIVLSLRNFARLDEAEMKPVDIHNGIENTLLLLEHRLRQADNPTVIEVIKKYDKIPLINCYASQLNQVFFNLLNNAIDALQMPFNSENSPQQSSQVNITHPQIHISTEQTESNTILIKIADNGPGISESIRSRIFDPFFTTKPPGSGTGLGLSISYQIVVQKHKGQLMCSSVSGEGSEFVIEIPIRQSPS